jgi:hypothetical protein
VLKQDHPNHQPIYKKSVLNGHGEPHPASTRTRSVSPP